MPHTLARRCHQVGLEVARAGGRYRYYCHRCTGERICARDYAALAQSSAFLAFVSMGGDPDNPGAFDWDDPDYRQRALDLLRRDLRADGANDVEQRVRRRRPKIPVDEFRWDCWRQLEEPETEWERDQARDALLGLEQLVRARLTDTEWTLLYAHYILGLDYRTLAHQRNTTVGALKVRNNRSRRKIQMVLGVRWRNFLAR